MKDSMFGLLPDSDQDEETTIAWICDFWNSVRACEEIGQTSWEYLEPLERGVTECLAKKPPDIVRAIQLTAKAMLLITGQDDF